MFLQREYIRENIAMDLNATYQLDLPEQGLLSSILIRISGSQASGLGQSGGSWRILDYISKVEILVNGATVCKSLKGDMVQALAFYDQGVVSPDSWRNYATNTQYFYALLNFGTHYGDLKRALNLGKFDNVEIKITNTATSSQFSDLTVSLLGVYLRDYHEAAIAGYMRTEEWRSWTTVQNETKYLDIPTEHKIRRIVCQAIPDVDSDKVEKTNMFNMMDDVDFTMKTGVIRIHKGGIDDIVRSNLFEYGANIITEGSHYMSADKGVNVGIGYVTGGAWGAGSQDGAGAATIATMETGRTSFTQKPETYEADSPMGFIFKGVAYQNTFVYRFDYQDDSGLWLDPDVSKTIKLDIHTRDSSSAVGGTNKVILDRFVPY